MAGWNQKLNWQTVKAETASVDDLLETPVLFMSGKDAINLGQTQKDNLKKYLENGGVLFAAVPYHGLYRSLDDGATWNLVDDSLAESRISTVAVNPNGFIFAGADYDGIVFQSTDGGDSWFDVSGWFPNVYLSDLAFNDNGQLLAGTHGFGVIYTDQTTPVQLQQFTAERAAGETTLSVTAIIFALA